MVNIPQQNDKKDRALIFSQNSELDTFAHLSYSLASLSPKHSKFSSLSSENSSCLKSGEVEAPMAESASVRECGDSLVFVNGELLDMVPPSIGS